MTGCERRLSGAVTVGTAQALFLPGQSDGSETPLSHFVRRGLAEAGRRVKVMEWPTFAPSPGEVADRIGGLFPDLARQSPDLVVVAIGEGSCAMPWAVEAAVPGVWIAPVLDDALIRASLPGLPCGSLVIGGTADPAWDYALAATSGVPVLQIRGADHRLEILGDAARSLMVLGNVMSVLKETFRVQVS